MDSSLIDLIPEKYRTYLLLIVAVSPYITRALHAVMNGRGIKGIFSAIWLGTNTPNPGSSNPQNKNGPPDAEEPTLIKDLRKLDDPKRLP
jgi:hypothetical protein